MIYDKHSWISVSFPFTVYTLVCNIHLPLTIGMTCYLCYGLDGKKVARKLFRHRINHMANRAQIAEKVKSDLPEYYHLEQIHFVEEFPYTHEGKVDYRTMEKMTEGAT